MSRFSMSPSRKGRLLLIVTALRAVVCTSKTDASKTFDCTLTTNTYSDGVYLAEEVDIRGEKRSPCDRNITDLAVYILKEDALQRRKVSRFSSFDMSTTEEDLISEMLIYCTKFGILFCPTNKLSKITVVFSGDILNVLKSGKVTVTPLCRQKNVMEISQTHLYGNDMSSPPEVQVFVKTRFGNSDLARIYLSHHDRVKIYNVTAEGSSNLRLGYNSVANSRSVRETAEHEVINITDKSMCGKTHGCFSYGENGCQHLNCTYFVSYKTNADESIIEISAKTEGWMAIGFSSDNLMGGDNVIACLAKRYKSQEYRVGVFKTPYLHDPPNEDESNSDAVKLLMSSKADGYVYCHIKVKSQNSNMEISNDWYQFYAWGPLGIGGNIEKHFQTPYISPRKLFLIGKDTYHTSGAPVWSYSLFLLFSMIIVQM